MTALSTVMGKGNKNKLLPLLAMILIFLCRSIYQEVFFHIFLNVTQRHFHCQVGTFESLLETPFGYQPQGSSQQPGWPDCKPSLNLAFHFPGSVLRSSTLMVNLQPHNSLLGLLSAWGNSNGMGLRGRSFRTHQTFLIHMHSLKRGGENIVIWNCYMWL